MPDIKILLGVEQENNIEAILLLRAVMIMDVASFESLPHPH